MPTESAASNVVIGANEENKENNMNQKNTEEQKHPTELENQDNTENPYVLAMCARMLIYYHLGLNYVDTEEFSEGEKHLDQALALLNQLSDSLKLRYITVVQDVYNNLGIINSNRDNHKKGLPLFAKAE